jgi:hypothetical protein
MTTVDANVALIQSACDFNDTKTGTALICACRITLKWMNIRQI